jgi:predicted nucleotidyltransferase
VSEAVPSELAAYLDSLVGRLRRILGAQLVGVYAGGSVALGAYLHGRSDLDVAAVTHGEVSRSEREAIAEALRHEVLPCPARGLELVLYPLDVARRGGLEPGYLLNLNTGADMPFRLDFEPTSGDVHWFAIDRGILADRGVALAGPPAAAVFAPIPFETVLPVLVDSLAWHRQHLGRADDAVLNAARTLRFVAEQRWSSKAEAGRWALARLDDPELVRRALDARTTGADISWDEAAAFVAAAEQSVRSRESAGRPRR